MRYDNINMGRLHKKDPKTNTTINFATQKTVSTDLNRGLFVDSAYVVTHELSTPEDPLHLASRQLNDPRRSLVRLINGTKLDNRVIGSTRQSPVFHSQGIAIAGSRSLNLLSRTRKKHSKYRQT